VDCIIVQDLITSLFYQVLYISVVATVIGSAILLIRKFTYQKILAKCNYIIWAVFIIALIFPISIPSRISIYNYIDIGEVKDIEKEKINSIFEFFNTDKNNFDTLQLQEKYATVNANLILRNYLLKIVIPNIWFIICVIEMIRFICSYIFFMYKIGADEVRDERIIKILEKCKNTLKIKKKIKIIKQDLITTPSITGLLNVKILFTDTMTELDDVSINDVIMHELSHYKRKDNVLNFVFAMIKIIHWFNPLIKIIFKYIKIDIELATDEKAISKMEKDEKIGYCETIVKIAGICSTKTEKVLGMATNVKEIETRIDMIALKEKFEKRSLLILIFTVLITVFVGLIFYPTFYGKLDIPKLYLELENSDRIKVSAHDENSALSAEPIKIKEGEKVKLLTEGGKCEDYIFYQKSWY